MVHHVNRPAFDDTLDDKNTCQSEVSRRVMSRGAIPERQEPGIACDIQRQYAYWCKKVSSYVMKYPVLT